MAVAGVAVTNARYRWVVLGSTWVCLAVSYTMWYSFSVFLVALLDEFHWSRAVTSLAFSIFLLIEGPISPGVGYLMVRFGTSKVMLVGAFVMAGGLAMSSFTSAPWMLYLSYGIIAATGMAMVSWVPCTTALTEWFPHNIGTAVGIGSTGIAVGIGGMVPFTQYLVSSFGWRNAYLILAGITLATIVPAALLYRSPVRRAVGTSRVPRAHDASPAADPKLAEPEMAGAAATNKGQDKQEDGGFVVLNRKWASTDWTLARALRTRHLWFLMGGLLLSNLAIQMVFVHHLAALIGFGIDKMVAASAVAVVGFVSGVGKVSWGIVADRLGREFAYTMGMSVSVVAIAILIVTGMAGWIWLAFVYALFFGFGYAVLAPVPIALTADLFSGRNVATIFGCMNAAGGVGGAIGAWLAGAVFDLTGAYEVAFIFAISCLFFSTTLVWLGGPRKIRRPLTMVRAERRHQAQVD